MFCKNCGRDAGYGHTYCPYCDTKLDYGSSYESYERRPTYSEPTPLAKSIRGLLKGPLMIVLIISIGLNAFLSLFSMGWMGSGLISVGAGGLLLVISMIMMLPSILNFIGLMVIRGTSASSRDVGGFGPIKATNIIYIVCMAIVTAFLTIGFMGVLGGAGPLLEYVDSEEIIVLLIPLFFIVLFIVGVFIYFAKVIATLNILRDAANNRNPYGNPSVYVVVINFIMVFGYIINFFVNNFILLSVKIAPYYVITSLLSTVLSCLICIISSVMIIKARSIINYERSVAMKKREPSPVAVFRDTPTYDGGAAPSANSGTQNNYFHKTGGSDFEDPLK